MPYTPPGLWAFTIQNVLRAAPITAAAVFANADTSFVASANMKIFASATFTNAQTELDADTEVQLPTLLHILVTGQSNSIGVDATPLWDLAPAIGGNMFNAGMKPGGSGLTSLVGLQEETTTVDGETGMGTMVRWLHANHPAAPFNAVFLVSNVGVNATRYSGLKKGTTPYNNHMAQVNAAKTIAAANGLVYRVLCVVCVHGETDTQFNYTGYYSDLIDWQSDYDTDCKAITGQSEDVPMFHAQQAAWNAFQYNSGNLPASTQFQLQRANRDYPTKIIIACPQNQFDYYSNPHFSPFSHAWQGEFFAKAIKKVCFDGDGFETLYCTGAVISGSTIVCNFAGGVSPLQIDFRYSIQADGLGFRLDSSAGTAYPTSAALTGAMQITLTFASPPSGTSKVLTYAASDGNSKTNIASNVIDSDATVSLIGLPLHNRLPAFSIVPT